MNGLALFLALVLGAPLGCGLALKFFGTMPNESNNHGDYVGATSKYAMGVKYTAIQDKHLHKSGDQAFFIDSNYKELKQPSVFQNRQALVKRPEKRSLNQ